MNFNPNYILYFIFLFMVAPMATTYFLSIWFDDCKFLVAYAKLFKIDKINENFNIFLLQKKLGDPNSYLDYLMINNPGFLTDLFTCDKCLSFWTNLYIVSFINIIFNTDIILWILSLLVVISNSFISGFLYRKIT